MNSSEMPGEERKRAIAVIDSASRPVSSRSSRAAAASSLLAFVDRARDDLDEHARAGGEMGAEAELLQEHDASGIRIVRQDGNDRRAAQDLAPDRLLPVGIAGDAMAKAIGVDRPEPIVWTLTRLDIDLGRADRRSP